MKQRFISGLIILLPIVVTWWLVSFVIRLTTAPFQAFTKSWIESLGFFSEGPGSGLLSEEHVVSFLATVIILLGLFLILCAVGILGERFFMRALLRLFDKILLSMPLVSKIYKSCKDFSDIIFSSQANRFSKVVLVPFPDDSQRILGLVTNEIQLPSEGGKTYVSVLIPGTPNPTVGFLLLFPKESIEETNIPVEEGMKWVISCGSANTPILLGHVNL